MLKVEAVTKIETPAVLRKWQGSGSFKLEPKAAFESRCDTILFHGSKEEAVPNIQASGLQTRYAAAGMLGTGLYGAPDPRKSKHYCGQKTNGYFIFVCRFNLTGAKFAGPGTQYRNSVYDELCVYDDAYTVPLWMIKLK